MLFSVSGFSIFSLFCMVFRLFMDIFQYYDTAARFDCAERAGKWPFVTSP